ncbi:ABC transporter ATP-binding protein [Propionibacteriaceae bacterium G57]|uniref:ABC transporter ATP-binding protein n=1 Tax=Aestuariimicrobium sp. G57 TaxID=3418485 RepID=UPI003DA769ED
MITFDGVEVTYGTFTAIPQLDLTIRKGEFFTLLGPSGCGKTTALRSLAGLTTPSAGRISIEGRDVTTLAPDKRQIGMVFQNYALFPSMNVADNIEFGLRVRRDGRHERAQRVREAADLVELSQAQLVKNLDELSGGQQQRVAIARALVLQPKILLLDEPLSNLDAKLRQQMRGQLKKLQAEVGITTVYVTHDQDEALAMSDRIAVFNRGRVEQVGTPQEVYDQPTSEFVCTFVGESSPLGADLLQVLFPGAQLAGPAFLREERASMVELSDAVPVVAQVELASYHGTHTTYTVQAHDTYLRVMSFDRGMRRDQGDQVRVWIRPADVLQYPPAQEDR